MMLSTCACTRRRAPRSARRRPGTRAASRARARSRCAGAGRRRTGAGTSRMSARGEARPSAAARRRARARSCALRARVERGRARAAARRRCRRTFQRGFRLAYGSWKIICMRRRSARAARRAAPRARRRRRSRRGRASARTGPTSSRATVLLPQPDSPTSASVWPRSIVEADAVDRMQQLARLALERRGSARAARRRRSWRGRATCDQRASARSSPASATTLMRPPRASGACSQQAARVAPASSRSGPLDAAAVEGARAARVEGAAGRDRVQPRHRAVDLAAAARGRSSIAGIAAHQADRVGMRGLRGSRRAPGRSRRCGPAYITATRSQVSAITPMSCVTSMTAAPCSRHRRLSSEMICAWIDTSSAVVGSSATISFGSAGERERDHDALAHAAGELVRVVVDALLRRPGCRCPRAGGWRAGAPRRALDRQVRLDRLDQLPADRVERVRARSAGPGRSRRCGGRGSCASARTAGCRCARRRSGSRRRRCARADRAGR